MYPEFSLIIPTYNRYEALVHCLEYLQALRFSRQEFEVIVVDDGSTDDTRLMTSSTQNINLRVIHQSNGGAAAARNTGILAARGLHCLFVDDDVMVHPDLLIVHSQAHLAQPRRLVRGPVINFPQMPPPTNGGPLWKHYSMNYLCTSNASLKRHHLLEAGLFDTTFPRWEDAELAVRLKRLGVERHFELNAIVWHLKPPESLESLRRTARKDGESAAALYLRYPSLAMWMRSGLHMLNRARNHMFTSGLLKSFTQSSAQGRGPFSQSLANWLIIEREYLDAGEKRLKQDRAK